jgi:dihydrofolate reductase
LFARIQKYVVSGSGDLDVGWQGSVLLRDLDAVRRLKNENGPNLVTQGSTALVHALLANDLADEIWVMTAPVVLGGGKKLFADGSAPRSYALTSSRTSASGLVIARHARVGALQTGDTALDQPSQAELARRLRMQREG